MEYQNYEEYMRKVLGYSSQNPNIYENYQYRTMPQNYDNTYYRNEYVESLSEEEAMELYPEIYRLVNPMVCKICETNSEPITKELIEKMTDEVYFSIEDQETIVNVRIETPEKLSTNNSNTTRKTEGKTERLSRRVDESKVSSLTRESRLSKEIEKSPESRNIKENTNNREVSETREVRRHNSTLRDLIKILILRQLLGGGRPPIRPPRPPFPGGPGMPPPRPPYPGGRPPMGGPNPPIMPRDYEDYLKF